MTSLLAIVAPEPWMADGACASHPDPDLWWPDYSAGRGPAKAQTICKTRCPVRNECLTYAIRPNSDGEMTEPEGVWGGATPDERRRLTAKGAA